MWAISGFCWYMIDFYVKYFPGSVFFNKGFFGVCDVLSIFYVQLLEKYVQKVPSVLRTTLLMAVIFSLMYCALVKTYPVLIPILVGLTRM